MNNKGYNWYTPELVARFSKKGGEQLVNIHAYLEQFILALWIPEIFMIFVLCVLLFTLAFWKYKSKILYIKMLIYSYVLILFLYQHTYKIMELGLRVTAHPLPNVIGAKRLHVITESLWSNYNLV